MDLVIFDCDGVLVDSEIICFRVEAAALAALGMPVTAEALMTRFVGMPSAAIFATLAAERGVSLPEGFEAATTARTLAAFEDELKPIAGIADLLARLDGRKCVASNSDPARIRHSLRLAGILEHFEPHIFSATQVTRSKPAPDLFLFAAAQMGTAPAHCLVIEDSVAGVTAACAAGMAVLGFCGGSHCAPGHGERLRAAGAREVFASMRDLSGHLGAIAA